MESAKRYAWQRRRLNGLLDSFCGRGIDVGAGKDPFHWWELPELEDCCIRRVDTWDLEQGDAHFMAGVEDEQYHFLYASHILEHLTDPSLALRNWVRIVRPGGVLLITVPHQHLYEMKENPPSKWNPRHKHFYQPATFYDWLRLEASIKASCIVERVQTGDWHYQPSWMTGKHPGGEYQIDALLRRC